MQRSIATVSISGTLVEKLTAIKAAGFDGAEIFENDLLYFDGSPADVRRIAADLGLEIMLFQQFRDFEGVSDARLARKRLGGGMRQAGVLAAPGLVALTQMVARLPEDHARAARLADAVAQRWPRCGLDPSTVRTNIVTFAHPAPDQRLPHLADAGVLAHAIAPETVRFVTHHDVDDPGISRAVDAITTAPGEDVA